MKNIIELDNESIAIFLKFTELLNLQPIAKTINSGIYTKNKTLWNPNHKSDIIMANKGMQKLNLFLKINPQKIAIDSRGVKFGG